MELLYNTERLVEIIGDFLQSCKGYGIPEWVLTLGGGVVVAVIIAGFIAVNTLILVLAERKVSAFIQDRLGPMRVGPWGCLQTVADALKLLQKEDITPKKADRLIFFLSPIIVFAPAVMAYVAISWSPKIRVADINLGLLYIFATGSLGTLGIILAGWSSANKWSLLGGMRSAAQIISYEVALILSVIGVIMLSGSLNLENLISCQKDCWYIVYQPLGFLLFLVSAIAETNRAPFDIVEAEQELVGGFHTEYSAMKFAMFFLGEYASVFIASALCATLFLGGWQPVPGLPAVVPPIIWFLAKCYLIVFIIMWIRWTYPRIRVDQLMGFSWKFLIPLGFLNIGLTGFIMAIRG
ncbi:MAG: NADH-quinone oxidoreductase subunit NuoH [bacterium]|nr:NADH-quinone oxidoreductase subunit NuoH [bacterium]